MSGEAGPASLLPHRFPFVLLDRILEVDPGRKASGLKRITGGDRLLAGGTALSGAFLLEAAAQLCAVASAPAPAEGEERPAASVGYLVGVEGFEIFGLPVPGDSLRIEVTIDRRMGRLLQASFQATAGGRDAARGRLTVAQDVA